MKFARETLRLKHDKDQGMTARDINNIKLQAADAPDASGPLSGLAAGDPQIADIKERLRKKFISLRANFAPGERNSAGEKISRELRGQSCLLNASALAAFYPMRFEPDIWSFVLDCIESGKKVYLPRFNKHIGEYEMAECLDDSSLSPGKFGIPEPPPESQSATAADLRDIPWLVPGVAFDRFGNRLGHGLGIFDRLLNLAEGCKIGICFDFQIAEKIPSEAGDVAMDCVVTENRVLRADLLSANTNKNKKNSESWNCSRILRMIS